MSFSCSVYGLGLGVNVPIAGLAGLSSPPGIDVRMSLGPAPECVSSVEGNEWREYYASPELDGRGEPQVTVHRARDDTRFRISYLDGTVIFVDAAGREVWATIPEGATVEDTATYLLGPTLGFVLRLRGVTCLHASAVAIDGRAVALAGPSGTGKSSTAAAFARLGYPVLTDDVAAIRDEGDRFGVEPAYPRVRLWPRSVESMFGSTDALPRITPTWDKRFLDLRGDGYRFQREPLPLGAVYLLGDRDSNPPRIEAVSAREGLMALVSDTYVTYLLERELRAREFDVLGRLVQAVPVRRAVPSADFSRICELCEAIVDDFRRLPQPAAG